LNTIVLSACRGYDLTVSMAILAASSLGKWNTPVEMQQKAMLSSPFFSARSRQER